MAEECCTLCAAAKGESASPAATVPAADKTPRHIRFGSYSLPALRVFVFGGAAALWITGILLLSAAGEEGLFSYLPLIPFLGAYVLAGAPVLKNAAQNLRRGNALDENFLMAIATLGAFAIGEWEEAVGVMIFYMIGELIQEAAVLKSRRSIDALLALKPDTARLLVDGAWAERRADDVAVGSLVQVRPGERIPLDGVVTEGSAAIDAAMLTGESKPVSVGVGGEVRSGTIAMDGLLVLRTTRTAGDSSAARIIRMVESAGRAKAKPERFITAFARWYTPVVVGLALALAVVPPLFIDGARFSEWLYRALILLVISCPCALVVSIPLGYFAGIGGMSRRGILVKGAAHLDTLAKAEYVAFDKTGTLTEGSFAILSVHPAQGVTEGQLLDAALTAESGSNHPIATAVSAGIRARGYGRVMEAQSQVSYKETAGLGVEARQNGNRILSGNIRLLESFGIAVPPDGTAAEETTHTSVHVAVDETYYGRIGIGDTIKAESAEAVGDLARLGVKETVMFTGDGPEAALAVASAVGISHVESRLLPEDKLSKMESLTARGTTVFVGDGINDAPVLARSDVGIAMGSGADVAVEAADMVIMSGDPRRVGEGIARSRRTRRIVMQNVVFSLSAKVAFITFASLGMANLWIALIADVGVALVAIANATRALR